jgi:hypothetical protein
MLSPELAERSSQKKCNLYSIRMDSIRKLSDSLIRIYKTSEIQIDHPTELLQDETDWRSRVFCENALEIHAATRCSNE